MNIEKLIELLKLTQQTETAKPSTLKNKHVGKYVVVRTFSAGVHCGVLEEREGDEVVLSSARRIWSWVGAFTLTAVAKHGIKDGKMSESIRDILLLGVIEVIPCSIGASKNLSTFKTQEI